MDKQEAPQTLSVASQPKVIQVTIGKAPSHLRIDCVSAQAACHTDAGIRPDRPGERLGCPRCDYTENECTTERKQFYGRATNLLKRSALETVAETQTMCCWHTCL